MVQTKQIACVVQTNAHPTWMARGQGLYAMREHALDPLIVQRVKTPRLVHVALSIAPPTQAFFVLCQKINVAKNPVT